MLGEAAPPLKPSILTGINPKSHGLARIRQGAQGGGGVRGAEGSQIWQLISRAAGVGFLRSCLFFFFTAQLSTAKPTNSNPPLPSSTTTAQFFSNKILTPSSHSPPAQRRNARPVPPPRAAGVNRHGKPPPPPPKRHHRRALGAVGAPCALGSTNRDRRRARRIHLVNAQRRPPRMPNGTRHADPQHRADPDPQRRLLRLPRDRNRDGAQPVQLDRRRAGGARGPDERVLYRHCVAGQRQRAARVACARLPGRQGHEHHARRDGDAAVWHVGVRGGRDGQRGHQDGQQHEPHADVPDADFDVDEWGAGDGGRGWGRGRRGVVWCCWGDVRGDNGRRR
ncbi:hypothetical protein B0T25DRAFT_240861 [Lasiosphaeria hispida]|uniref:Uncharacterized protein n=1 Tax=Lasiosphaeria hispida TaxID=260671 RepID=A0AAJ0HEH0_9PEZI|nr:hypothetical protein B0T25DRAFT_240861 [Lasiosphaeria hispida]